MSTPTAFPPSASKTPALFWWLVLGSIGLALIPTMWMDLDVRAASVFFPGAHHAETVTWWWVRLINDYVPTVFRMLLFASFCTWVILRVKGWRPHWRLPLAFFVLAGILGPGLVVNQGFKDHWQRARPYQVENFGGTQQFTRATVMTDQCTENCSFVSGHVACGIFFAGIMLVHRRRQVLWAVAGVSAGSLIAFSRMADHAHWLSDVLWAWPITLMTSWLVWQFLLWGQRARAQRLETAN